MAHVWRHIAQSAQGLSHIVEGAPCQDSNRVAVMQGGADETLVACVADGAGTAKYGEIGSRTACESIISSAKVHFETRGSFSGLQLDDVVQWCEAARALLKQDADRHDYKLRDCATTLCAAIISPAGSYFFQIGDGAIIVRRRGVCGVVFWPQRGEYANTTNFITAPEYRDYLQFCTATDGFSDVALFTDGIERLALRFDSRVPHMPFFEPLFQVLRSVDGSADLSEDLRKFLQSDSMQSRSDDDKTLIVASLLPAKAGTI